MNKLLGIMTIRVLLLLSVAVTIVNAQSSPPAETQNPPVPEKLPSVHQRIEVTATRMPEDPTEVPAAIGVITGDELAARDVRDLRTALSLAIGIEIAPGGDGGPASSVPAFWGLKEFDAFLLVVDGVPWGGAFNPALISLDLNDIERIEVLRGPAPVTYGATSFVGVIQIVHKDGASKDRTLTLRGGTYGTGGFAFSTPVPLAGRWASRLSLDAQREGFRDDRTAYRRGHGRWTVDRKGENSKRTWFTFDLNWLDQDPASPRPRDGAVLSPLVPVDSNHNPAGAFLNDHRFTISGGFDERAGEGLWSTTASVSHSRQHTFRGFLQDIADATVNADAHGFRKNTNLTDVYLDSHFSRKLPKAVTWLAGADYLHGTGTARGADFDYTVPLNGARAVQVAVPSTLDVHIDDNRNFFGVYSSLEWHPLERLRLDGGLRVNLTHEGRADRDLGAGTSVSETRTDARINASVGAIVTAWQNKQDSIGLYVNYRDTFKPAAIDFGIAEIRGGALILQPETSRSVEAGIKGRFLDRRVETEASGFLMNFNNLVTPVSIGGLPGLINAGKQRFQGFESGVSVFLPRDVMARGSYSFHDAKFRDFVQDFGGVATQLAGKRLEMSARHLAAFDVLYTPLRGFLAGLNFYYTGSRFLNRRNNALAEGVPDVGITAGYRTRHWELRVEGRNLGDRRDPVSESELGDAQYYLLPARRVDGSFIVHF